ncbi:MAG: hypothetical protein NTZ60_09640 [Campylobacterales bacterium]|nr:hypothetical protein [Campylobacterales bacterium]
MTETTSLSLIQSVIDSQKDLIILFKGENHILTNRAFNNFFGFSSLLDYNKSYGAIVDNFVPHPSYFHKEKIEKGESWLDAILKLDEMNRIVSMMTPTYDPCAFSVAIDRSVEDYSIVTLTDITRDLIKRIMIENNVNIDLKSGAYDKKYFLQVSKSFEDAAVFNEKILGVILATVDTYENPDFAYDKKALTEFVNHFKQSTRQDDMLVRWDEGKFLLIYFVDNEQNAQQMVKKLQNLVDSSDLKSLKCKLSSVVQNEKESITSLIRRVQIVNP